MSITKERFAQGMSYDAYKGQMTRNRERLEANESAVELAAADLAYFQNLPQTLNVVALAEDWCGDVINNLPVLGRLAAASGKLQVSIFLRDQNLDIMDQYLKDGQFRSIPVFVFFDENFRELGHWIERPARIHEMLMTMRRNLFATDPAMAGMTMDMSPGQMTEAARDRYMQANADFRAAHRTESNQEVVRELRALVERGLAG
jgi:hypothetical protein